MVFSEAEKHWKPTVLQFGKSHQQTCNKTNTSKLVYYKCGKTASLDLELHKVLDESFDIIHHLIW